METKTQTEPSQAALPATTDEGWSADQEAAWRGTLPASASPTEPAGEAEAPPSVEEKKPEIAEEKPKSKERLERGWSALAEREQKLYAHEREIKERAAQFDELAQVATALKQGSPTDKLKALQLLGADISELGNAILQSHGVESQLKKDTTDEDRLAKLLEEKFGGIKSELEELRSWKQEQAKQARLSTIYSQIAAKIEDYPFIKTMASVGNQAAINDITAFIENQIDEGRPYDVAEVLARAESIYEQRLIPELKAYASLEKVRTALGQPASAKSTPAAPREGKTLAPSLAQDLGPESDDDILSPDEYLRRGVSFLQRSK